MLRFLNKNVVADLRPLRSVYNLQSIFLFFDTHQTVRYYYKDQSQLKPGAFARQVLHYRKSIAVRLIDR